MPAPRSTIVDEAVTPWYHCISRCVRRAFLCGQGYEYRKQWIENRLKELVGVFAVELAGFAVMDNHLHLLVRLDSKKAQEWSVNEVVRRWLSVFPLRDTAGKALPLSQARLELLAQDAGWVAKVRKRLGNLSWFMKCLKEPLARLANRQDGCSGAFWIRPSSGKRPAWCLDAHLEVHLAAAPANSLRGVRRPAITSAEATRAGRFS